MGIGKVVRNATFFHDLGVTKLRGACILNMIQRISPFFFFFFFFFFFLWWGGGFLGGVGLGLVGNKGGDKEWFCVWGEMVVFFMGGWAGGGVVID